MRVFASRRPHSGECGYEFLEVLEHGCLGMTHSATVQASGVCPANAAFANPDEPPRRRIALLRRSWRLDSGAARQINAFLDFFESQSCETTLIACNWEGASRQRVLTCKPLPLGRVWREWAFTRKVQMLLAERRFDLVQSHERIPGCDVYRAGDGVHREWLRQKARVQSRLGQCLTAVSPWHWIVKRNERRMFEGPQLRAVICNSRMVRDEILQWFQIDPRKLHVIYNGVDTARFHPELRRHRREVRRQLGIPHDATLFAFVGSALRYKGLATAIEAMSRTPGAWLVVIGKDKHKTRYQRQARRLACGDRLRMVGVQPDVAPFYGAADALVLPSLYDAMPSVALEAMAAGLPVLTSTKCGAAELIVGGDNGYVRDALDAAGFANAMCKLTDPPRRRRMGEAARVTVEPLNLEATRRRLTQLYTQLLDERID
jgi:UDP-glucose:(heptosyl)LPS alpha-1,3-glucosyltransferase